ncbi:antitoxin Xre/MbcA/ParS toxin-binding domain-containing protein [Tardiphaga robiniae]|uniref:antitoxin Xre/MbcA/ParS toxin-binding domain-containing protein n=1 Tax=Tardiphaga robiniae TaxID=943830 RepID=UPI003B8A81BD
MPDCGSDGRGSHEFTLVSTRTSLWQHAFLLIQRAGICALVTDLFGSEEETQRWPQNPAFGLERRRPVDQLDMKTGVEMVEDYLIRIDRCVYD